MNTPTDFPAAFTHARQLHVAGQLAAAEKEYLQLLQGATEPAREGVVHGLVDVYMQTRRPQEAVNLLVASTREAPDSLVYYVLLATLLDRMGQTEAAIEQYQRFLERQPDNPTAYYNLALLYRHSLRYSDALSAYETAVDLGIDNLPEVYSNMGVLYSDMRQAGEARAHYERALEANADYIPARFNLAALHEEAGERDEAVANYSRILEADSDQFEALARLAHLHGADENDEQAVDKLQQAIERASGNDFARESLYIALGKTLDDQQRYQEAFEAYGAANALAKGRQVPYDRSAAAGAFDQLVQTIDADWISRNQTGKEDSPIFICGMFRSGSTLVEQILAAHPEITAGGELDYMPWLITRQFRPYPGRAGSATPDDLGHIAGQYQSLVKQLFPDAANVTDKRPDNFLNIGPIAAAFPRARFVFTQRAALDTCLSIYFTQLDGALGYATELGDIAFYYAQHARLMEHWKSILGERIFTVNYDELVRSPEPVVRNLLAYLGLPWDDSCLDFSTARSPVKTASVWQVREGLHSASSGRWRNYEPFIQNLEELQQLLATPAAPPQQSH